MKEFSLLGIGAAFLNLQRAKKAYEAAIIQDDDTAILAAISQYERTKYNQLDQYDRPEAEIEDQQDIMVIPVLNAGDLGGKFFIGTRQVALMNVSNDRSYTINDLEVQFRVYGEAVYETAKYNGTITLDPQQQIVLQLPVTKITGIVQPGTWIVTPEIEKVIEAVRTANQRGSYKPLITFCEVNTCIVGNPPCVTADVSYRWFDGEDYALVGMEGDSCKGTFCYKGGAYHPKEHQGWEIVG